MITDADKVSLAKLLERNAYVDDPIKDRNLYNLLVDKILPYYDKSRFMLSNLAYAYRKIITVDSVCKEIGEYKRYPISEREIIILALLSDLHKVANPFDRKIEHSTDIADREFGKYQDYYFRNRYEFERIITSTYSQRTCMRLNAKLLHDINILVRMDPAWYFCAAWHDYQLLHKYDLDEYNHGEKSDFVPTKKSDEELMMDLWKLIYRETISTSAVNWQTMYVPEIKASEFFSMRIKVTEEAIKSFDTFKNIIDKNEYILFKWPV